MQSTDSGARDTGSLRVTGPGLAIGLALRGCLLVAGGAGHGTALFAWHRKHRKHRKHRHATAISRLIHQETAAAVDRGLY